MDNYEVLGQIGKGSFGLVQKIKRKSDGKILVWKEMNYGKMSEREKQQLVAEVNIIRELRHANIVRYYDRIIEKKDTKIFIIMEFCEGGDMGTLLKKCKKEKDYIAEDVIWKIFTQIVLALNECHNRTQGKILHRDLKPANIFLDSQNNIKLGDFGLSRVMGENSEFARTHVGTPYYMSPEQIQESKYNEKSDIWSAGCLLYEMAALKPPFEANNHLTLAIKIKSGKFERLPIRYSEELQKLVESMLNTDPEKRPSVQNLIELQQISLRLKERKLREKHSQIKVKEDELKKREEQLQERLQQIDKKEKDIELQVQILKEIEEQVKSLEVQVMLKSSQTTLSQDEVAANNSNAGQLPQKSARGVGGDYQLLSQNLNNFGKDILLLNKQNIENNNNSGNESKNSTTASSNNTFELYKKEKENLMNNNSNFQNNVANIDSYKKEKEIQRQLQNYSSNNINNNKNQPLFQKSNSSIVSQSLTDQQMYLQQQNSLEVYASQQGITPSSQKDRTVNDAQLPPQNSCSSNSSNECNPQSSNNKQKNYTLYSRREQDAFQKTPVSHQNYHQQMHHQQSTEIESITKKNGSYAKDHQYKSVDNFTSIQNNNNNNNNNNSSSKKDESTAFSTTCKMIPQSASQSSQHQNIINQSSNKSSHKSSCENLPKKNIVIPQSSSNQMINQFNSNDNQNQSTQENNPAISNTGMSAFEKYKASVQAASSAANNTYSSKYAQIKSKARVVSTDQCEELEAKSGIHHNSKLHIQQPILSKQRVQTSIDSTSYRNNPENKNYLNSRREAPLSGQNNVSQTLQKPSAITRRSANTTIDSGKYSQINNQITNGPSSYSNGNNNNNNVNLSHDIYKQVNMRRTDSYKENGFKITNENTNQNILKPETGTLASGNNQTSASTTSSVSLALKNTSKHRPSIEPKNRLHSYHSTTSAQQVQTTSSTTSSSTLNINKPPMTQINTISSSNNNNNNNNNNEDIQKYNFKTLPNTEFSYNNSNSGKISSQINSIQMKKKNNNSFSTTPSSANAYLNTNSNYISNNSYSNLNGNNSGNNTARNKGDTSIERKKEFLTRPRNNYLLPQKLTPPSGQQQSGDVNTKNYFTEQPNQMVVQTEQLYNKYVGRRLVDQNVVSPSGQQQQQQYASTQYRTATQY